MKSCVDCGNNFTRRHQIKFCSNKCQNEYQYKQWVIRWKNGEVNGGIGITARNISQHLRRYLEEKFRNQCSVCGWHQKHPITGVIPFEIDHIDGNADNNSEAICNYYAQIVTRLRPSIKI